MIEVNSLKESDNNKNPNSPIKSLAHFKNSKPHPLWLKLTDNELKIEQVVSTSEEKLTANRLLCFRFQSEIAGALKPFEIKLELSFVNGFRGRYERYIETIFGEQYPYVVNTSQFCSGPHRTRWGLFFFLKLSYNRTYVL